MEKLGRLDLKRTRRVGVIWAFVGVGEGTGNHGNRLQISALLSHVIIVFCEVLIAETIGFSFRPSASA